jgi:hypothetical protein
MKRLLHTGEENTGTAGGQPGSSGHKTEFAQNHAGAKYLTDSCNDASSLSAF